MKIQNLIFYIATGLFLCSLNCGGGLQKFQNHNDAKKLYYIKFELTGYGFVVVVNHTADNGKEEMLDLHWTDTAGQNYYNRPYNVTYSYSKTIQAIEGETIFFRTTPKTHICSMQMASVTLKITINGKAFSETSAQTSIWEEIILKRGMLKIQPDLEQY